MKLLFDTHALVWWLYSPELLSKPAYEAISQGNENLLASAISAYEIANKHRLGKWLEVQSLAENFDQVVLSQSIASLPVTSNHARVAAAFRSDHRDPFDRILAAQASSEGLILVTRDPAFVDFGVETLW